MRLGKGGLGSFSNVCQYVSPNKSRSILQKVSLPSKAVVVVPNTYELITSDSDLLQHLYSCVYGSS